MVLPSAEMLFVANSTPIVDFDSRLNSFRVNRERRFDLPTPESPMRTTVGRIGAARERMGARRAERRGTGLTFEQVVVLLLVLRAVRHACLLVPSGFLSSAQAGRLLLRGEARLKRALSNAHPALSADRSSAIACGDGCALGAEGRAPTCMFGR